MKTIGLILAGGSGTRFWPLSRTKTPKQVLKLAGDKEMINFTIDRCNPYIENEDIYIITNEEQAELLQQVTGSRMTPDRIFSEPSARNTAPCILYSALRLRKLYGDAVVCVLSSDQSVKDEEAFRKVLSEASDYALKHDAIVTIGITPTFPSTGYGYIKTGGKADEPYTIYHVQSFVEKPDLETASEYLRSDEYLWNSGMFIFRISTILDRFQQHLPEMYNALLPLDNLSGAEAESFLKKVYPTLERISIDYGIMEKESHIAVIPGDFGWSDIGAWNTLEDVLPPDSDGNIVRGDHIGLDTRNCVIFSGDKTVATIGLSNIVIVNTPDSVLVCNMDDVQDIKRLTDELKKLGREDLL
jgi:mannose-1-phosphate guanylyltransferase